MNYTTNRLDYYFIREKELRAIIHNLKKTAFENNGILFGEVVLNNIISNYYKNLYMTNVELVKDKTEKFWDASYDNKTAPRTIVSNNISIYFKHYTNVVNYMYFIKSHKMMKIIKEVTSDTTTLHNYKYIIRVSIGSTFIWDGYNIDINLNIIFKNILESKSIEPPFNEPIFLNDTLIMTYDSNGPRFSRNTGLEIDNMDLIEKNILFTELIKNICNFKTYIVSNENLENNNIANKSIDMISNGWNISNMPFIIDKNIYYNDKYCCICLEIIDINDNMSTIINNNGSIGCALHCRCLFNYITKKIYDDENLVCPYKQYINFSSKNKEYLNLIKY
tara:strand:+ start:1226 stop:2227 length:1002 start_codon:yes stop_codon:yes gene_type:complete